MAIAKNIENNSLGFMPEWDLSDLYSGPEDSKLKFDIELLADRISVFSEKYQGKVEELDAKGLAAAIKNYEEIAELSGKVMSYAYLYYTTAMHEEERAIFFQNTSENISKFSTQIIFFVLQLNEISQERINQLLQSSELSFYKPWIIDTRAFREHQLSEREEELLSLTDIVGAQSWHRFFDETVSSLQFPFCGQILSCSEILNKLSDHEPENRKLAAKSIGKVFGDNIKTFAFITNTLAKDKQINDMLRNFSRPISSPNLLNFIEDEVVDALIKAVKDAYPNLSHRYYKLKAKWFGQNKLDYWDRNAPLPSGDEKIYKWQEGVDVVLSAYKEFSPRLAELGGEFFKNNWIDASPKAGKNPGAFAHPTVPSNHPYLLLNYMGRAQDVMTLAHELGHGVHQLLSQSKGALMHSAPLTLAETASVFGEQLTFRYLLARERDEKRRKILIAEKVESMLNTVVRQIAFCEFERRIHEERKNGEIPVGRICDIWLEVQKESLGEAIHFDDEYKYFWSYIPHFIHSPFYVYSYAFGDCLVNSLYQTYLEGLPNFEDKYFALLEAGGSKRHKEMLAPFGLDASKPEFWHKGLDVISGFITQLEQA